VGEPARDDRPLRGSAADIAALLAVWIVAIVVVDPRGDFPLNDDWTYGLMVRRLIDEGVFRPHEWSAPNTLSQALWGAAAAALAGFSFTALRLSTLALGGAAMVGVYLLARTRQASRRSAVVAALTLAAGPVFFALSYTFMTDVPFTAFAVLAMLGFAPALAGNLGGLALGCAFMLATVLCRQSGIVLPLAFGLATLGFGAGTPAARAGRALLPLLISGLALGAFSLYLARDAAAHGVGVGDVIAVWGMRKNPPAALRLVRDNLFVALLYCGLFLAPAVLHASAAWRATLQRPRWYDAIAAITAALVLAVLWSWQRGMPFRGNVLIASGLGPITLHDLYIRGLPNDGPLPRTFWMAVTAVTIVGAALLVAQLAAAAATVRRAHAAERGARALLLLGAAGYLAAVCVVIPFDRYYLPLVALLAAALAPPAPARTRRATSAAAYALLAALLVFSIAGTRDYLSWNRARWQALHQLTDVDGVSPHRIDGGPEFNGPRLYSWDYRPQRGKSWWWVDDDEFIIAMGPVPGYSIHRRYPYSRWLPPGTGEIVVLHRDGGV
jgi:hypothetical protein